jgi:hypothetical protein
MGIQSPICQKRGLRLRNELNARWLVALGTGLPAATTAW